MKIALYIEDGREQIVLTPTSQTEKALLGKLHDGSRELSIHAGSFYACRGGWTRQGETRDESTMIVLDEKSVSPPTQET
ncbi:hypothetical protein LH128_01192 [Sphingomonas sp. LH128]|uniref:hypothetical protein n=1 Tax=Sphingomonas sp. LH128 TaxID=473781 RepID=UPI00027CC206|nr:hypothetical protein [Sphingomonas sp. LH128]EJU14948.1 hypothetical protein LH128_01192 [Sphingomonas sp. LH128]